MKGKLTRMLLLQIALFASLGVLAKSAVFYSLTAVPPSIDTGMNSIAKNGDKPAADPNLQANQVRLDATYGKNFFEIIWTTQTDNGCDHFEVERSLDGIHFQKLGEVKATVPSTPKDNFFFRDNFRAGIARKNDFYYRLKQVELNGQSSRSKILIARMYGTRSVSAVSITPDPALNHILVNVQLKQSSYVVMKLSDQSGNEVFRKSSHGDPGLNIYKLEESSRLQPGNYSLEIIINSKERMNMKLIKS